MEQSAQVTRLAHARMLGLLSILWILDACLIMYAVESILIEGPTVMIMFASEVSSAPFGKHRARKADLPPLIST